MVLGKGASHRYPPDLRAMMSPVVHSRFFSHRGFRRSASVAMITSFVEENRAASSRFCRNHSIVFFCESPSAPAWMRVLFLTFRNPAAVNQSQISPASENVTPSSQSKPTVPRTTISASAIFSEYEPHFAQHVALTVDPYNFPCPVRITEIA